MNLFLCMAMKYHQKTTVDSKYGEFVRGRSSLTGEFRENRPVTPISPENIEDVHKLILEDRHVTYFEIETSLGISATSVHKTLHEHLAVKRMPPNIVRTGAEHLLEEDPDHTFQIIEIINHPGYMPPIYYHDIALIRFDPNTYYVHFACLPPEHLIYDEDIIYDASRWGQVEALGYGATSFGGPTDDLHLVKVNIDLLPDKNCTESFPPDANQPKGYQKSTQICAGDVNKGIRDTCQGDSGGPLQRLFKETFVSRKIHYVFGVTSYGRSCGSGQPAIYTRVTSYLDWIESIVWRK